MTRSLVIVGCGGFGREVFSVVETLSQRQPSTWRVEGFVDDAPADTDLQRVADLGSAVIGDVGFLAARNVACDVVIAIGSGAARRLIAERLPPGTISFPSIVHPQSTVGLRNTLGPGVVLAPGVRVSTNVEVGAHVHIDQNAVVGHDCVLGAYSRVNPQACLSGNVVVGQGALIGANATVLPGLEIGAEAVVGAGAVVTRSVAPHTVVMGVPARP